MDKQRGAEIDEINVCIPDDAGGAYRKMGLTHAGASGWANAAHQQSSLVSRGVNKLLFFIPLFRYKNQHFYRIFIALVFFLLPLTKIQT